MPLQWAGTQNNLGTALATLGQNGDLDALKRAITAFDNAGAVYARLGHALHLKNTQHNLALAKAALAKAALSSTEPST